MVLIVNGVETPLRSSPDRPVSLMDDADIKVTLRVVVSGRVRQVTRGKLEKGIFQRASVD